MISNCNRQDSGQKYNQQAQQPFLKMDFPRFTEGDDLIGWIYRAEHYFEFLNIEDSKKVKLTLFHMEGEALQWFQWAHCLENFPSWGEFSKVLCQEFGPSELEDYVESLVKLRQTGTVTTRLE